MFMIPPSIEDIAAIARAELKKLPAGLLAQVNDLIVQIDEFPDEDTEDDMELESCFDLLGLYRGASRPDKGWAPTSSTDTDMMFLYRRPLLDYWCETGEDLSVIVRNVLIHEIGQHFGLSDEDVERLEAEG